jgi:hypothetical protein
MHRKGKKEKEKASKCSYETSGRAKRQIKALYFNFCLSLHLKIPNSLCHPFYVPQHHKIYTDSPECFLNTRKGLVILPNPFPISSTFFFEFIYAFYYLGNSSPNLPQVLVSSLKVSKRKEMQVKLAFFKFPPLIFSCLKVVVSSS